jgi:LmbE family N-acetylglucosaminyl deacetylase
MTHEVGLKPIPEDWSRAVAIVAHPDDLEYGAASAIARWTSQGKSVVYVLVTRGEAGIASMNPRDAARIRSEEERASARKVGVETVEFLDHNDGVIEYGLALRRDVARVVRRHRPEVIITINHHETWGGMSRNTPDHQATGRAAIDGSRDASNGWIFPELLKEGFEPWGGVRLVFVQGSPYPTHAVDVADFLRAGVESLKQHKAYLDNLGGDFDPDTFLRSGAASTGQLLGVPLAVGFELIAL